MQYNCCGILNVVLLSSIYIFSVCFTTDFCLCKVKLSHWKIFTPPKAGGRVHSCGDLEGWERWAGETPLLGASHVIFFSSPTFEGWLCYKVSLIPGWIFRLLEPWIPLSQHVSSLSDLPESPGTCEIYNKMLLLPFPSLPSCAQRWGIHGITGGPE